MSKASEFAQAGKVAVQQNILGLMEFLQKFPPFNQMENAHLGYVLENCQLRFYGAGESILKPSGGPVQHFYSSSKAWWWVSVRTRNKNTTLKSIACPLKQISYQQLTGTLI